MRYVNRRLSIVAWKGARDDFISRDKFILGLSTVVAFYSNLHCDKYLTVVSVKRRIRIGLLQFLFRFIKDRETSFWNRNKLSDDLFGAI